MAGVLNFTYFQNERICYREVYLRYNKFKKIYNDRMEV